MISVRKAGAQIFNRYRASFPARTGRGGIVANRIAVIKDGKLPHIRIHEVKIRGPLVGQWPPASQQAVLGDRPFTPERTREILDNFASRAYRRPARADEVDRLLAVTESRRQQGHSPFEALKD